MKPAVFNSLLSTFTNLVDDGFPTLFRNQDLPAVNVREEDGHYRVEVIAPGLKKDDFKLAVNADTLTVSAKSEREAEENKESYRRKEYNYYSFSRSFVLPEGVESDGIQANYTNGVLHIDLKKKANASKTEPKLIPIQ